MRTATVVRRDSLDVGRHAHADRGLHVVFALGEAASDDIAVSDHAAELVVAHHTEAADVAALHLLRRHLKSVVLVAALELARHNVLDGLVHHGAGHHRGGHGCEG